MDKNGMILAAVHSLAANDHDSRGLKPLIRKLAYKPDKYMHSKVTKCQPTCLTFIVEVSNTVYRRSL
ncbi:MAG: hypothetical protein ACMUEL_05760 [Flavobacteriales bacterium Tduv]